MHFLRKDPYEIKVTRGTTLFGSFEIELPRLKFLCNAETKGHKGRTESSLAQGLSAKKTPNVAIKKIKRFIKKTVPYRNERY